MKSVTISVKAVLRADKPVNSEGKRGIYLLVYNGSKQLRFSTKLFVEEKYWDKKGGNVITKPTSDRVLTNIKDRIRQMEGDFMNEVHKRELAKKPMSEDDIRDHFNGKESESFYYYYSRIVEMRKPTLRKDTYRIYFTTLWILKEFKSTLTFEEIDNNFVRSFDSYLRSKRGNKDGGVVNKHKNLKYVIRQAIHDGLIIKNPYRGFAMPKCTDRIVFLKQDEIMRLEALDDYAYKDGMKLTLDMFLFACYTGLRFSDVITLERKNIDFKNKLLTKEQVKTDGKVQVYLCDKAISILRRNMSKERELCFERISNPKVNKNLKKLMLSLSLELVDIASVVDPDLHGSGTFAWIRIRNYSSGSGKK